MYSQRVILFILHTTFVASMSESNSGTYLSDWKEDDSSSMADVEQSEAQASSVRALEEERSAICEIPSDARPLGPVSDSK